MSKGLGRAICKRVCHLPTEQKPNTPDAHTPLQNHRPRKRTPVHTDCHGPHHGPPREPRLQQHTDHSRPRVLSWRHLLAVSINSHGPPDRPDVLSTRVPVVRPPFPGHIRPRPPFHITLREIPGKRTRRHMESVNGLSPPDGWAIRMEEPVGGTIPPVGGNQPRRVELGAPPCHSRT